MAEVRKLAAILVADIVGFSRLTANEEDRTLTGNLALRSDLVDPTIEVHRGRVVKATGDGPTLKVHPLERPSQDGPVRARARYILNLCTDSPNPH